MNIMMSLNLHSGTKSSGWLRHWMPNISLKNILLHTTTHRNEHNPCKVKRTVTNDNFWYQCSLELQNNPEVSKKEKNIFYLCRTILRKWQHDPWIYYSQLTHWAQCASLAMCQWFNPLSCIINAGGAPTEFSLSPVYTSKFCLKNFIWSNAFDQKLAC